MWDKFGELNSAEEINVMAAGLLKEEKREDIYALAEENGLDKEMVDLFIAEDIDFICDDQTAACGKLDMELKDYQKRYVANAIEVTDNLKNMMGRERIRLSVHKYGVDIDIDITGEELAQAIRQKGKVLNNILKDVFTKAQMIHNEGNPASDMVVPMVIHEYLKPAKKKKGGQKK